MCWWPYQPDLSHIYSQFPVKQSTGAQEVQDESRTIKAIAAFLLSTKIQILFPLEIHSIYYNVIIIFVLLLNYKNICSITTSMELI